MARAKGLQAWSRLTDARRFAASQRQLPRALFYVGHNPGPQESPAGPRRVQAAQVRDCSCCSQKALVSHAALAGAAMPARTDSAIRAKAMVFMEVSPSFGGRRRRP